MKKTTVIFALLVISACGLQATPQQKKWLPSPKPEANRRAEVAKRLTPEQITSMLQEELAELY